MSNGRWMTLALLIGALIGYSIGFETGAVAAFSVGVILELGFWWRLLRRPGQQGRRQ